ncbi:hypothetical protein Salat_2988000 [Sesamum alatum]|uniref:Uncharacterized protein n=1 Tax=Sesamum alatum TaxID=300844 RepID=A0AAE1XIZ5_9LAMI|nr:hypothetical protein Salat_2992700 [Sesamum alatum]KAK4412258.1 hypothetical protein Salat_2988000 [Sesamum alatum]
MSPISRDESHLRPSDFLRLEPIQERLKPLHNRMQGNHVREKGRTLQRVCARLRGIGLQCLVIHSWLSTVGCRLLGLASFLPWHALRMPFRGSLPGVSIPDHSINLVSFFISDG